MNIRMVDTVTQYQAIQKEVDAAVLEVMQSGAFINGPAVRAFTEDLASYLAVPSVIPCANGTDALQIALMGLGLKPGDEVLTPAFTYIATVEVIALLGLKPVFVDVLPDTFNIDPAQIEDNISERTKAIVPVHLFGQSADMAPILEIAKRHNLAVIEDNAQAIGASYTFADGTTKKTGTMGDVGCTSFYPSKNLGAFGDGGAMCTNDEELGATLRVICNHGCRVRYYHESIGVNSRLDSIQAAILGIKLKHLDTYNDARRSAADLYDQHFAEVEEVIRPVRADYGTHVFHQYTLKVKAGRDARDKVKAYMDRVKVPSMIYYPVSAHQQEAYQEFGSPKMPVSEQLTEEVISLPMHSEMNEAQVEYIVGHFKQALASL